MRIKPPGFKAEMVLVTAGLLLAFGADPGAAAAEFPQGLVLHFSFDQMNAGGIIPDQTGRNNARASGARLIPAGKQGNACEFASTNSFILVVDSPSLNPIQATFAAWFKVARPDPVARYIFDKLADNGYALSIAGEANDKDGKNKGKLCFWVNGRYCLGYGAVMDGAWHHGAATFDGENLKLYVDGQLQKSVVSWRGEIAANTNDLTIGMNRSNPAPEEQGRSFCGALDELMVFNRALSEAEVQAVIASAKPKFTREQVARRLAGLKELYDRGLILKDFYDRKVRECEVTP